MSLTGVNALDIFGLTEFGTKEDVTLLSYQLGSMIPDTADGWNTCLAQALLEKPSQLATPEYHKLLLYRISNNLDEIRAGEEYFSFERWVEIVDILENSGITSSRLSIGEKSGLTISAFVEKLFRMTFNAIHVMRLMDSTQWLEMARAKKLVLWMLSSGQTPNIPFDRGQFVGASSPLQLAVEMGEAYLASQLLDAGADPSFLSEDLYQTIETVERCRDTSGLDLNPEIIEVLKHLVGAGVSLGEEPRAEIGAVRLGSLSLASKIVQARSNVSHAMFKDVRRYRGSIGEYGRVAEEAKALDFMVDSLEYEQPTYPSRSDSKLTTVDVVMNAAANGHLSILEGLRRAGCNVHGAESKGVTALHVAANGGFLSVCKSLLCYGSLVDGPTSPYRVPPPIILAALEGHKDIVQLLYWHGARLNNSFNVNVHRFEHVWSWARYWSRDKLRQNLSRLGEFSINPAGAAILGSHWNNETYRCLAEHGARLPEWAVYHGTCDAYEFGIVEVALKEDVNVKAKVNWVGDDKKTPLQSVLSSMRRMLWKFETQEMSGKDIEEFRTDCVSLCFKLLNAGAVPIGGEAQLAMFLDDWSLVECLIGSELFDFSRQSNTMSLLEAAFLSGSEDMIQHVLERTPAAYDDGALCAAVLHASEHRGTTLLRKILQNRQKLPPSHFEGTAMGLAAWSADMEVLKTLYVELGTPRAAFSPIGSCILSYKNDVIGDRILDWKSGKETLPFWYGQYLGVTGPLWFILQSKNWASKLRELDYIPEEHTIRIDISFDSNEILKIQLVSRRQEENIDRLYLAVRDCDLDGVKTLLNAGGDVNLPYYRDNDGGKSCLQESVQGGSLAMMDLLLKAGAEVNAPAARCGGATALQLAAILGRIGIAKMLIDLGADIDAPRAANGGRTALEGAAERGRIDTIQLLLSEGAATGGKGRLQYMRALKFAECEGHLVAANMLREHRDWITEDDKLWRELEQFGSRWEQYGKITRCLMNGTEARWIDE